MSKQNDSPNNPNDATSSSSNSGEALAEMFLTEVSGLRQQYGQNSKAYKQQVASLDQTVQSNHLVPELAVSWAETQFKGQSESKQDLENMEKKTTDPVNKLMLNSLIGNFNNIKNAHSDPVGGLPIVHWFSHQNDSITNADLSTIQTQATLAEILLGGQNGTTQGSLYGAIKATTGDKQSGLVTEDDLQNFIQKCNQFQSHPDSSNSKDGQYLNSQNESLANFLLQSLKIGMLNGNDMGDGIAINKLASTLGLTEGQLVESFSNAAFASVSGTATPTVAESNVGNGTIAQANSLPENNITGNISAGSLYEPSPGYSYGNSTFGTSGASGFSGSSSPYSSGDYGNTTIVGPQSSGGYGSNPYESSYPSVSGSTTFGTTKSIRVRTIE